MSFGLEPVMMNECSSCARRLSNKLIRKYSVYHEANDVINPLDEFSCFLRHACFNFFVLTELSTRGLIDQKSVEESLFLMFAMI